MIQLPKGTKLVPQDASNEGGLASLSRSSTDTVFYQPLTVKVDFTTNRSTSGLSFVGGSKSKLKKPYWHAYTTHSPLGQATSSWLPCVDGLWELCTWEVEISVPRTISQVGGNDATKIENGEAKEDAKPEDKVEINDDEQELEKVDLDVGDSDIVVVCNNLSPDEV